MKKPLRSGRMSSKKLRDKADIVVLNVGTTLFVSETDAVDFLKRRFSEREERAENPSLNGRMGFLQNIYIWYRGVYLVWGGIVVLRSGSKDQAKRSLQL